MVKGPKTRQSVWAELEEIRTQRAEVASTVPPLEIAFAINDGIIADTHIKKKGAPGKRTQGALVRRGFLQVLGGQKLPESAKGSGRLELADWLTQPDNSLTASVMVNRVWHYHFGLGLVTTPSDFGVRGTAPTHPGLLDHLATEFMNNGWAVKQMHRAIMAPRTYRLTNEDYAANLAVDPGNQLLWRANRRRLDAEQLRDALLVFSGELDRKPGGRHPFPHHLTYFPAARTVSGEVCIQKRSIYLMQQRIQKNPYLDLFDGPDGSLYFGERRSTVTTLQALYFMNSEFIHEQADAIAERLAKAATGSTPLVQAEKQAWSSLVRSMLSSNEFLHVE